MPPMTLIQQQREQCCQTPGESPMVAVAEGLEMGKGEKEAIKQRDRILPMKEIRHMS